MAKKKPPVFWNAAQLRAVTDWSGGMQKKSKPGTGWHLPGLMAALAPKPPGQAADLSTGDEPAGTDVRDAQYWADKARREFQATQEGAELDRSQAYDTQDLHEALRRMGEQRPQDEQRAKEAANRQGLLFSGALGKDLGEIGTSYARRQGDTQTGYDRRQASREAARAALEQGLPIEEAAALAGAAGRQIESDSQAALGGYLVKDPEAPTPAATAAKPVVASKKAVTTTGFNKRRGQRFLTVKRRGSIFHRYAGGRDVRVR